MKRFMKKKIERKTKLWAHISGGIFFIGLAILFYTRNFWPGILVLIGVMSILTGIVIYYNKKGT